MNDKIKDILSDMSMGLSCGIFFVASTYSLTSEFALVVTFISMMYCIGWLFVNDMRANG